FSEKIIKADGLIIITPEYNHGYPGELKLLLDMLYKEYARKPVGICGVSKGAFGGSRAVEQLKQMAIEFHMTPIREAVYFSFVQSLFNEDGSIKDESYSEKISKFMQEFLWYAKVLKKGREEDIDNLPLI
ncbi:MAG: NAD(P)H-dependent oxidoreductase, partial [Candidatus Parcubacteria bacterium]|nr:NAD(P)H-dependent oxidoreductase [Candidatus Parcubacteria bacterium]